MRENKLRSKFADVRFAGRIVFCRMVPPDTATRNHKWEKYQKYFWRKRAQVGSDVSAVLIEKGEQFFVLF